jgi:hypothetical protein
LTSTTRKYFHFYLSDKYKEETTISIRSVKTENIAIEEEKIPRNLS